MRTLSRQGGDTALMYAASGGKLPVVRYLLKQGADVNAIGEESGMTPLMRCLAARHRRSVYFNICRALLDAGAGKTLNVADASGRTALDWPKNGRPDDVLLLISTRANSDQ